MKKSNFALRLRPSLAEEARKVAKAEGVAENQLINVAVAEKVSALRTEEYFVERAARGDLKRLQVPMPSLTGVISIARLFVAGNERVPIGEAPVRVVLPRPDVQFVKRRQSVAVRSADQVQQMPVQSRLASVLGVPNFGDFDEFDADEAHPAAPQRLVDQRFRLVCV
jgi:hypothetical protein